MDYRQKRLELERMVEESPYSKNLTPEEKKRVVESGLAVYHEARRIDGVDEPNPNPN